MTERLPTDLFDIDKRLQWIEMDLAKAFLADLKGQSHIFNTKDLESEKETLTTAHYLSRLFTRLKEICSDEEKAALVMQIGEHDERKLYWTFRNILDNYVRDEEDKVNSFRVGYIAEVLQVDPPTLISLLSSAEPILDLLEEETND